MAQHIGALSLLVDDYDRAIAYYTEKLGFSLIEDSDLGDGKRWVLVAPPGGPQAGQSPIGQRQQTCLLLVKAADPAQQAQIGRQAGGRVFLFLHTDNFERDFAAYQARGVHFLEEPRHEAYGSVAVFEDLYGNRWDLLQLKR